MHSMNRCDVGRFERGQCVSSVHTRSLQEGQQAGHLGFLRGIHGEGENRQEGSYLHEALLIEKELVSDGGLSINFEAVVGGDRVGDCPLHKPAKWGQQRLPRSTSRNPTVGTRRRPRHVRGTGNTGKQEVCTSPSVFVPAHIRRRRVKSPSKSKRPSCPA